MRKSNRQIPGQAVDYNFDSNDPQIPQAQQEQHRMRDQPAAREQAAHTRPARTIRRPKRLIEAPVNSFKKPTIFLERCQKIRHHTEGEKGIQNFR